MYFNPDGSLYHFGIPDVPLISFWASLCLSFLACKWWLYCLPQMVAVRYKWGYICRTRVMSGNYEAPWKCLLNKTYCFVNIVVIKASWELGRRKQQCKAIDNCPLFKNGILILELPYVVLQICISLVESCEQIPPQNQLHNFLCYYHPRPLISMLSHTCPSQRLGMSIKASVVDSEPAFCLVSHTEPLEASSWAIRRPWLNLIVSPLPNQTSNSISTYLII